MARRGRQCHACSHPRRGDIDVALARGMSCAAVAKRYPPLSVDTLQRHRKAHMSPILKATLCTNMALDEAELEEIRTTESKSLINHLVSNKASLYDALQTAYDVGDFHAIARLNNQLLKNIEMTAKLLGDWHTGTRTVNLNLAVNSQWIQIRADLTSALEAHPEAALAVAQVLRRIDVPAEPRVIE